MILSLVSLFAGCALLYFGGDWIVDGARSIARRLHISTLLVSVVLIGFGTSAPELFVSVIAAHSGHFDVAIANVVGSNTANILLILAISGLIFPVATSRRILLIDGTVSIVALSAFALAASNGFISRYEGAALLVGLIVFVLFRLRNDGPEHANDNLTDDGSEKFHSLKNAAYLSVLGLVALQLGAHFFVDGAIELAHSLGISQAVIGLTVVALGTSLPELAACVRAAMRRHTDVVIGNILGSNIFNSTVVIGAAAIWVPLPVSRHFLQLDLWVMLAATILGLIFMRTSYKISRMEAGVMLAAYGIYVFTLTVR